MITYISVCHTEGCPNKDVAIPVVVEDSDIPVSAFCAPCQTPISDIQLSS